MVVKKSMAHRFIDWFPRHTKLCIRGERGADWAKAERLYRELAEALGPFLEDLVSSEIERRSRQDID